MRITLCGRNLEDILPLLKPYDVEIVDEQPDIVISYGGDGALLGAERDFPGVPKCPIRDSRSTPKCPLHSEKSILSMLFNHEMPETSLAKLTADIHGKGTCTGLNDIVLHRLIIASAVRYRIWLNDQLYANQIVGDGLVASTPFGSTGYYRSITHSLFNLGIGLAFNNSTEPVNHLVIEDDAETHVEILRGPGMVVADNDPAEIEISTGDEITIRRAGRNARVLGLDVFRCPDCYWLRQHQTEDLSDPDIMNNGS